MNALGLAMQVPEFEMLLPIGISFYTFMSLGYVADVYLKKIPAEHNVLDFFLFIGFFPQIASGPIGRAPSMLPQFKEKHPFLFDNLSVGAKMMLWGFFMKLVVGDRAGIYVDTVFGNYANHNGGSLLLATFMYTIQIYCDFAGYSLIAIGSARIMGYELMTNFRRPYFAISVTDFWRRWHISLSTWFRDYVYIPCGGSRVGEKKLYRNIMITFLTSGLWHGAAYNFIVWGAYHGIAQIIGKMTNNRKIAFWKALNVNLNGEFKKFVDIALTFIIVSYGWMIFYVSDFSSAIEITKGYFHLGMPYMHQTTLFFFAIGFLILFIKDFKDEFMPDKHFLLESKYEPVRYVSFAVLSVLIVLIGVLGGGQFIYFKF
jgi:D-alanyl-lipoteichoic acid acyltransferase DltB (MBOAT superfamily)